MPPAAVTQPDSSRSAPASSGGLTFPQAAKLELDDLLEQLVGRAQEALNTQGRLRGLLSATRAIAGDLSLPVLLHRIVEVACELVGAQYGALGVVGPFDELTEFITVGFDADTVEQIGQLPRGDGLLGKLISDPTPLRLRELSQHPESADFPPNHPPMRSFLGVPIRVRDQVFGNVYLTEKNNDMAFTADDEELLISLASAAGVAIDNARLLATARRRQLWLEASAEIARVLLAGEADPLALITSRARELADAELAYLLIPDGDDPNVLLVVAADDESATELPGARLARTSSPAGQALSEGRDLQLAQTPNGGPVALFHVLGVRDGQAGILSLGRRTGARPFAADEVDMVASLASQAGLAMELAHAQQSRQQLLLMGDRDRIARDLHDLVIQRLFATGLGLSGIAATSPDEAIRASLLTLTDQLDDTIHVIRDTIFELHETQGSEGFRSDVLAVIQELKAAFGFSPQVRLNGPLDTMVGKRVAEHATAVLREGLTNVARHAQASGAQVLVSVDNQQRLTVAVTDDGIGIGEPLYASGLANVRSRAEQLGGSCTITSPAPSHGVGTQLTWVVPLDS